MFKPLGINKSSAAGQAAVKAGVKNAFLFIVTVVLACANAHADAPAAGKTGVVTTQRTSMVPAVKPSQASQDSWEITEPTGAPVRPIAVLAAGQDLYFLGTSGLWKVESWKEMIQKTGSLPAGYISPPEGKVEGVAVHEFSNFAYLPQAQALVLLDKSGDLLEYFIAAGRWKIWRPNKPVTGPPDPEFIDLAVCGAGLCILDPERNEIWEFTSASGLRRCFKEIMPWRAQAGDPYVGDGLSIACMDGDFYVLKRSGAITKYGGKDEAGFARQESLSFKRPLHMRPSRLICGPSGALFIVERENNRVVVVDKGAARTRQYLFPGGCDLRGLFAQNDGFYIIDGNSLVYRSLDRNDGFHRQAAARGIDPRLKVLSLPLEGVRLPRHPGVWPGARRLYRYGVHQGVDFFDDLGCSARVVMGTPAYAAAAGKVTRADANFRDLTAGQYAMVMHECLKEHNTSDHNEDLLRGCQVWIDHGKGLTTRYAHLSKIKEGLKAGDSIKRGDLLGYVGVSGTGQNLPGKGKHPHLHFEIWLDGQYLGWGLTPGETIGVYEDIFGTACQ